VVKAGESGATPGPRPGSRTEQTILKATRALLAEGGVRRLTVEGVAARSGVAKTTIYRRWRSKEELALAVLIDMVDQVAAVPDLGNTHAEFVAFVNGAVKILGKTLMGRVMQGLVSDLAADPGLAQAFRERVVGRRVAEVRRVVERGIARGDLRPDTDHEMVNELLFGPVYYRLLLSGAPLDAKLAERVVTAVLPIFAVRPKGKASRTAVAKPKQTISTTGTLPAKVYSRSE
jgi:AcrR family transcriptional regulator